MEARRLCLAFVLVPAAAAWLTVAASAAQEVLRHPEPSRPLAERWQWALDRAGEKEYAACWVGYSIVRVMEENSFMGSIYSDARRNRPSLRELLSGVSVGGADGPPSEHPAVRSSGPRLVPKEIAVLLSLERRRPGESPTIREIRISNMSLRVELGTLPLFWLDGAVMEESFRFLEARFGESPIDEAKETLLHAVALHDSVRSAFAFLREVLAGAEPGPIRSQAAFGIGQWGGRDGLAILTAAVEHDRSEEVREQALFAISQLDSAAGLEALLRFARDRGLDKESRERAIFWLSQLASQKAVTALEELTEDDDAEVQRQALYALAQTDDRGLEAVIEIATSHPNRKLRRDAIYLLGQSDDPRALDAIVAILRK